MRAARKWLVNASGNALLGHRVTLRLCRIVRELSKVGVRIPRRLKPYLVPSWRDEFFETVSVSAAIARHVSQLYEKTHEKN